MWKPDRPRVLSCRAQIAIETSTQNYWIDNLKNSSRVWKTENCSQDLDRSGAVSKPTELSKRLSASIVIVSSRFRFARRDNKRVTVRHRNRRPPNKLSEVWILIFRLFEFGGGERNSPNKIDAVEFASHIWNTGGIQFGRWRVIKKTHIVPDNN